MKSQFKLAAASLTLAVLMGACSPAAEKTGAATTAAAPATPASADVQPFRVGAIEVVALRDGGMTDVPNDNQILGVGRTPADVSAVLTAAGLPGDSFDLSIQPLLVRDGERLVLIDAGAGSNMGPAGGKLPASLRAAGIEPGQITDVLISHGHGDHIGGLVDGAGALVFPNAAVRMAEAEWTAIQAQDQLDALVAAITPKVQTFQPGATVTPSIAAVPIVGHTIGHMGYEIRSGDERLLYIADTAHHSVVSVQRPDWANAFDGSPQAMAARQALLERAAADNLRIHAVHFPWPGVGRIQRQGDGFVWVPETAVQP